MHFNMFPGDTAAAVLRTTLGKPPLENYMQTSNNSEYLYCAEGVRYVVLFNLSNNAMKGE